MDPSNVKRRLTCILAADAFGYSDQMGRDEEGTIRVLAAHRAVIDGIIAFHQGRIVSTAGDSVLAEFASAVEAVRCAVEIQEALKTRNDSLPEHRQMRFRVGVNLGDVVVNNDDLLGDGVNVAARLETMAEPGGICISSSVYDQITGKLDLGFQDIGKQTLKNISRPIHVYRVSGAAAPVHAGRSAASARRSSRARSPGLWIGGAVVAAAIVAVIAWQAGAWRSGTPEAASKITVAAPATAPAPSQVAQAESDAQRLRAEAEAAKREAEAELARARQETETLRAARAKADADAKAAQVRAQAEADAVRIRANAEAAAARTKSEAAAAVRATSAPAAPAPTANRFDGAWTVTVACGRSVDGAARYRFDFPAEVKDGYLRGVQGTEGAPGSLQMQGRIAPDGSANLQAKGLTGDPKFNLKGARSGIPYGYQVAAQFEGSRGSGNTTLARPCEVTFAKQ